MPKRRRRVAAVMGIALGVYVLLAALPYAFPPAAERAQRRSCPWRTAPRATGPPS